MKPPKELYSYHVHNLRAIDRAMHRLALAFRHAISVRDDDTVASFTPLYALLLGAWAECRLQKLMYEPAGFDQGERGAIRSQGAQLNQWQAAVQLAFQKQYNVTKATLTQAALPGPVYSRYTTLIGLLKADLRPVIELRNKLAHGQWVHPLNRRRDDVAEKYKKALQSENLLSLQFKRRLLSYLAETINDLVVSRPAFERDFDTHFRAIVETRRNLATREYGNYVEHMRNKYQRGREQARRCRATTT